MLPPAFPFPSSFSPLPSLLAPLTLRSPAFCTLLGPPPYSQAGLSGLLSYTRQLGTTNPWPHAQSSKLPPNELIMCLGGMWAQGSGDLGTQTLVSVGKVEN